MLALHAPSARREPLRLRRSGARSRPSSAARPDDPAAADRLRTLDLELRRAFFQRRDRIRQAGCSSSSASSSRSSPSSAPTAGPCPSPMLRPPPVPDVAQRSAAVPERLAVTVTGLLLGGGALVLYLAVPAVLALPADDAGVGRDRAAAAHRRGARTSVAVLPRPRRFRRRAHGRRAAHLGRHERGRTSSGRRRSRCPAPTRRSSGATACS